MFQKAALEEEHVKEGSVDERSVDDLLSFINGNDAGKFNIFYPCFSLSLLPAFCFLLILLPVVHLKVLS